MSINVMKEESVFNANLANQFLGQEITSNWSKLATVT